MSSNQTPRRSSVFMPTTSSSSRSRPQAESFSPTTPLSSRSRHQTEVSDDIVEKYMRGEPIPVGMLSAARARALEQQQPRPSQPIPATQGTERVEAARSESVSRPPQLGLSPPPPPANALAQLTPGTPCPGPSVAFGASFPSVEFSPAVTTQSLAPATPSPALVFGSPAPPGGTLFGNVLPAVPFEPVLPGVSSRSALVSVSSAEATIPQGFTLGGPDTLWHNSTFFDPRVHDTPGPAETGSVWDDPDLFDTRHRDVEAAERAREASQAGEPVLNATPVAKADRKVRLTSEHREWIAIALGNLAPEDRISVRDFVASKVPLEVSLIRSIWHQSPPPSRVAPSSSVFPTPLSPLTPQRGTIGADLNLPGSRSGLHPWGPPPTLGTFRPANWRLVPQVWLGRTRLGSRVRVQRRFEPCLRPSRGP